MRATRRLSSTLGGHCRRRAVACGRRGAARRPGRTVPAANRPGRRLRIALSVGIRPEHRVRATRSATPSRATSPTYTNRPASSRIRELSRRYVPRADSRQSAIAEDFLDDGAEADLDLRMLADALAIRGLRGERAAAMQDDHTRGVCASVSASCSAESPPPTTATTATAKRGAVAARTVAHALARSRSSPGIPSVFVVVPVAITTARVAQSPRRRHAPAPSCRRSRGRLAASNSAPAPAACS